MSTPLSSTAPSWPQVYLDEDVRADVHRMLSGWNVPACFARERIGTGHSDDVVIRFASSERSILITSNAEHFLKLARRGRTKGLMLLVLLCCKQGQSSSRLASVRDLLELELRRRPSSGSHGITIEVHGNFVRVHR